MFDFTFLGHGDLSSSDSLGDGSHSTGNGLASPNANAHTDPLGKAADDVTANQELDNKLAEDTDAMQTEINKLEDLATLPEKKEMDNTETKERGDFEPEILDLSEGLGDVSTDMKEDEEPTNEEDFVDGYNMYTHPDESFFTENLGFKEPPKEDQSATEKTVDEDVKDLFTGHSPEKEHEEQTEDEGSEDDDSFPDDDDEDETFPNEDNRDEEEAAEWTGFPKETIEFSEEDLIDLMYEDRHLSPYRRVFKERFGDYPDEEELLELYKQVAGDVFSLDKKEAEDESEIRWKIYSEIYMHHFKEMHLRVHKNYPTDNEVYRFQRDFHVHLNRFKTLDPEEVRRDAELGVFENADDGNDTQEESKDPLDVSSQFDIPEVNDETEAGVNDGEQEQIETAEKDPTEVEDEDSTETSEAEEVSPEDAAEQEAKTEETPEQEGKTEETPEQGTDVTNTSGSQETDVGTEPEVGEQDPTELVDEDDDDTEFDDEDAAAGNDQTHDEGDEQEVYTFNEQNEIQTDPTEVQQTQPEINTEPEVHDAGDQRTDFNDQQEKHEDDPTEENPSEDTSEMEFGQKIDLTEQKEQEVPISTQVINPEEKSTSSQVGHPGNAGMPSSDAGQVEVKVSASQEAEAGESSTAPDNVAPVPTSLEHHQPKSGEGVEATTVIEDGVTTIVQDGRTTEVVDGTTIFDEESEPEVSVFTSASDLVEPSESVIENTAGGIGASVTEEEPSSQEVKSPANSEGIDEGMPSESEQTAAEVEVSQTPVQHDAPQATQQTDSFSSDPTGQSAEHDAEEAEIKASESTHDASRDKEEVVEPDVKVQESDIEAPGALSEGVLGTNDSQTQVGVDESLTRLDDDDLSEKLDPYSPSGEYVSRTLQSHQASGSTNQQPNQDSNTLFQANQELNSNAGEGSSVPNESDENVPSPPVNTESVEDVTPIPVAPDSAEQVPVGNNADAVTEPTPILSESPAASEPEQNVPPSLEEPVQNDHIAPDHVPATEENTETHVKHEARSTEKTVDPSDDQGWLMWYGRQVDKVIGTMDPLFIAVVDLLPPSIQWPLEHGLFGMPKHRALFLAIFVIVMFGFFSAMCVCGESKSTKNTQYHLVKLAELEEKYFIAVTEKDELEEDLEKSNKETKQLKSSLQDSEKDLSDTKTELDTTKLHNSSLKKQVKEQQEQAAQVQQTLEQWSAGYYAKEGEAQQYLAQITTVTDEKTEVEKQLKEVKEYLNLTKTSSTDLESKVMELNEEITVLQQSKDQLQLEVETWNDKVRELDEQLKEQEKEKEEMKEQIAFKDNELDVMRDCLKQLKSVEDAVQHRRAKPSADNENGAENTEDTEDSETQDAAEDETDGDTSAVIQEKISAMMDVSRVSAQLKAAEEDRDHIKQKYTIEIEQRKELEDEMAKLRQENEKLSKGHQQAEKQSQEASTKLSVLQQYFKEKEVELQKELGEQEVLKKEKASLLANKDETVKTMETEMSVAKVKVEDLQAEIGRVEKDYRTQIALQEKKAHENWLAARQAERELKESKSECSSLRQKLVELERMRELDGPGPPGLIRPLPQRGMLPPDMLNGPPGAYRSPPPLEGRPGSRGSSSVHGPQSPSFRDDFGDSPFSDRGPPPHMRPPGPFPPPPMHPMDRPPFPLDRDGRPLPPLDRDGRPLPPLDRDGRPLPPFDHLPPLDRDGRPMLPPLDRDGRPLPPLDRDGRPLSPPDQRSPPPFDRRPPPPHDRMSPPGPRYRSPPPDFSGDRRGPPPPGYRGGPPPPDRGGPSPPGRLIPPSDGRSPDGSRFGPRTSSPYSGPAPRLLPKQGSRPTSRQQNSFTHNNT